MTTSNSCTDDVRVHVQVHVYGHVSDHVYAHVDESVHDGSIGLSLDPFR